MASIPIQSDEKGLFLAVGPERADEVRTVLSNATIPFVEDDPDGAGCAGPGTVVFRLGRGVEESTLYRALESL